MGVSVGTETKSFGMGSRLLPNKSFTNALVNSSAVGTRSFAKVATEKASKVVTPDFKLVVYKCGDIIFISVDMKSYKERLKLFQFSLVARVVLSKGDITWKLNDLKVKLCFTWNFKGLAFYFSWTLLFSCHT